MTDNLIREFQEINKNLEDKIKNKERLEGKKEQLLSNLKEFGCFSIKKAKNKLEEIKKENERLEKEFNQMVTEFKKEYQDLI